MTATIKSRRQIIEEVREKGYAKLRGIIDPEQVIKSVVLLKKSFSMKEDHPTRGESPDAIRQHFQKLNLGGASERYNNFPRFFRTFYTPLWEVDRYQIHPVFKQVARVRNSLMDLPENFALEGIEPNGLWTASRIHQYPRGGGFFISHRDTTLIDVSRETETEFFQLLLVMSKKGIDFQEGGAFVIQQGQRESLEDTAEIGDIIVYDGQSEHGVEDIDPEHPLDLQTINGRIAGLVSLYKKL